MGISISFYHTCIMFLPLLNKNLSTVEQLDIMQINLLKLKSQVVFSSPRISTTLNKGINLKVMVSIQTSISCLDNKIHSKIIHTILTGSILDRKIRFAETPTFEGVLTVGLIFLSFLIKILQS